jgi:hypothetical protein
MPSTAALEVKSQKSKVKSQKTYILGFCAIWNGMFIYAPGVLVVRHTNFAW